MEYNRLRKKWIKHIRPYQSNNLR